MFPFLSHVQLFPNAISAVCRLKYPYCCFPSKFCFLVFLVVLFVFMLPAILQATAKNISLLFLRYSSRPCIDASTQSSTLLSPLLVSFLDAYSLSMSYFWCRAYFIVISFLVFWFIGLSSCLVHYKNGPKYLTRGTA